MKGEETADDVIVQFMDSNTWEQTEVQATLPGSTSSQPARIELFGVTNISQAWREGMYYAASNSYRRILADVSIEMDGRLLLKGDPVIVSHDVPNWSQSGFVNDYLPLETTLVLDRNVTFSTTDTNYLVLRRKDGKEFGPIEVLSNGYSNEVVLEQGSLEAIEISQGITLEQVLSIDDEAKRTTFVLFDTDKYVKRFIVTSTTMRGMDKVDVSLVIDDERVYGADTGTPPEGVDYLGPGVTPNGPSLDSVTVHQDPLSGTDPVTLIVAWSAVGGATQYISQYSYDGVNWITGYSGGIATSYSLVVNAGDIYIRTAAVGTVLGPWKYISPNPQNFGTATLTPGTVSNLNVNADIAAGVVEVSYNSAPRATSYLIEIYTESVSGSGTFDILELSRTTSATGASFVSAEVTAAGGPWSRIQTRVYAINDYGTGAVTSLTTTGISLGTVTGLSLTSEYHGVEASIQWSAVSGASAYRVKIYNDVNTLVRETVVTSTNYFYSNSQLTTDGGPWRAFSVKVNAESSTLVGAQATLSIADVAPPVPSTITSSSPSAGNLTITWSQVMLSDVTKYQVFVSTTNGFTPATGNRVIDDNVLGVTLTGLSSGTTYYYRIRTIDSYAGGTGYIMSAQFSRLVS
jgi:hypothetical protein